MQPSRIPLATISLLLTTAQTALANPVELAPSSDWTLWARDDSCRIFREFGSGDDRVTVQFEKSGPASSLSLLLAGKPVAFPERGHEIEAALGPANVAKPFLNGSVLRGETAGPKSEPTLLFGSVEGFVRTDKEEPFEYRSKLMPKRFAEISWLTVGYSGGKNTVKLQLQDMSEPLSSLRRCTMSLLRSWGFDPGNAQTMPVVLPEPKGDAGRWVLPTDYPSDALVAGQSAVINFRLMIDAAGKPQSCNVQSITIGASFRERTCKSIMKRARFDPARNADGQPVPAWYENSVRWVIPY